MTAIRKLAVAAACAMSLVSVAHAQDAQAKPGPYVGLSLGRANGSHEAYEAGSDPSLGLFAGYRFNEQLSLEVFGRALSFRLFPNWLNTHDSGTHPDRHIGLAVVGDLPLGGAWRAYGRAGLGRTRMEGNNSLAKAGSVTETTLGAGLAYEFSSGFGLRFGLERYNKSRVNVLGLGGEVRF
ncbi:porin family protein [Paucibacter sp. APW11]|uniref:Porin family protein n=1 Tax=Roseateles aquae TaxID=3077235 RepID=A0ABU3PGC6_9BURK|nr:porin family protein [Paucibacter sp. APW11]MDT9001665.1 porin family protein [Paucibacter sp. APW11]